MHASEGADGAPLDKGNPVIRPYIPISRPEHEGELVLIIKKYESGVLSKYVHERLKPTPRSPSRVLSQSSLTKVRSAPHTGILKNTNPL